MRGRLREILERMLSATLTGLMERHSWKQGRHAVTKRGTLHADDSTRSPHLYARITSSGDNESNFEARLARLLAVARFFLQCLHRLIKTAATLCESIPGAYSGENRRKNRNVLALS